MKIDKIQEGLWRVTPEEDMHLTQNHELSEDEQRLFCCSAYELTEADCAKWTEWTEEQKVEWEEESTDKND